MAYLSSSARLPEHGASWPSGPLGMDANPALRLPDWLVKSAEDIEFFQRLESCRCQPALRIQHFEGTRFE
jgi:hypothetical protein